MVWKRDEAVRPPSAAGSAPGPTGPDVTPGRTAERDMVNIGKSVVIKGELSGSEDLTIEGAVDGKIELKQNVLTIGPNGKIKAEVFAKSVVVQGEVHGNITATEKVDIRDSGSVDGDVVAPRVAISDGAHFRGSIDMQRTGESRAAKPAAPATPSSAGPSSGASTTGAAAR